MIINTGQCTDIPAFFSKWFYNRIKAGFLRSHITTSPFLIGGSLRGDVIREAGQESWLTGQMRFLRLLK